MQLVCLDMENVLWPEIWPEVAKKTGLKDLAKTTRDVSDTNVLYKMRNEILAENGITLSDVIDVIRTIEPMDGAIEFLDKLKKETQFVVLSDTFEQFTPPIREKLGYPTIICNKLIIDDKDQIVSWEMRCENTKLTTVKAFQSVGIETICAGDSYNDLGMIQNSKAGFLFNTTDEIKTKYPDIPALNTYDELLENIKVALAK